MKKNYLDTAGKSFFRVVIFLFLFLTSIVIANLYISQSLEHKESLPPSAASVTTARPTESVRPPLPDFPADAPSASGSTAQSQNHEPTPAMKNVVREAPLSDVILAQ